MFTLWLFYFGLVLLQIIIWFKEWLEKQDVSFQADVFEVVHCITTMSVPTYEDPIHSEAAFDIGLKKYIRQFGKTKNSNWALGMKDRYFIYFSKEDRPYNV